MTHRIAILFFLRASLWYIAKRCDGMSQPSLGSRREGGVSETQAPPLGSSFRGFWNHPLSSETGTPRLTTHERICLSSPPTYTSLLAAARVVVLKHTCGTPSFAKPFVYNQTPKHGVRGSSLTHAVPPRHPVFGHSDLLHLPHLVLSFHT